MGTGQNDGIYVEGLSGGSATLTLSYLPKDCPANGTPIELDHILVSVVPVTLGAQVYDPKLQNAGQLPMRYTIQGPPADAEWQPRVELTILDAGATEVACLVRRTEASPAIGAQVTRQWDGRWGQKKDGTGSTHVGRYADPGSYTVELNVYRRNPNGERLLTRTGELYVVRLGVRQLGFLDDQELLYHKTAHDDPADHPFTNNASFADDIVWQLQYLDFYPGGGATTQWRREKRPVGESFHDANNSGAHDAAENYYDADGNGAYSAGLRQVNFPGRAVSATAVGGIDTNNFNRPATYVRNSQIRPWFRFGQDAISDVTHNDVAAGYPITVNVGGTQTLRFPIRVRARYGGMQTVGVAEAAAANATRNISRIGGPYTLVSADDPASRLPNNVGHRVETIEFSFQYNARGETFVDTDGNGSYGAAEAATLTDRDGDGALDEDWQDIAGSQTTTHLMYRLAAQPTVAARAQQADNRLWCKIVDFTGDWGVGAGAQTSGEVFDAIWGGGNFWTPIAAGPRPDNANGFHGLGDPTEAARTDKWGNTPKCYTYDHDAPVLENVQYALDNNVTRCGGWARFLTAFAGYHGSPVRPLQIVTNWIRVRGGVPAAVQPMSGGILPGDTLWMNDLRVGHPSGTIWMEVNAIHGQANPNGGGHLGPMFNLHRVAFSDDDGMGDYDDGVERIYDPSYEHTAGNALAGWIAIHAYEQDAFARYRFPLRAQIATVDAAGNPTALVPGTEAVNVWWDNGPGTLGAGLTEVRFTLWGP